MHAPTTLEYAIPKDASYFQAVLGLSDDVQFCYPHTVRVTLSDETGNTLFDSDIISDPTDVRYLFVDVRAAKILSINVHELGDGRDCDHLDLANALFLIPDVRENAFPMKK